MSSPRPFSWAGFDSSQRPSDQKIVLPEQSAANRRPTETACKYPESSLQRTAGRCRCRRPAGTPGATICSRRRRSLRRRVSMGFLDKAKSAAEQAAQKAKDTAEDVQTKRAFGRNLRRARPYRVRADRKRRDVARAPCSPRRKDPRAGGKARRGGGGAQGQEPKAGSPPARPPEPAPITVGSSCSGSRTDWELLLASLQWEVSVRSVRSRFQNRRSFQPFSREAPPAVRPSASPRGIPNSPTLPLHAAWTKG